MKQEVPFINQTAPHLCGPAALLMVLKFLGIDASESEIVERARSNPETGTANADLAAAAASFGLRAETKSNADYRDIVDAIKRGRPAIVSFIEPEENEGHFGVVVDASENEITYHDPWSGANRQIKKSEFEKRWRSKYEPVRRWLLVISRPAAPSNSKTSAG